MKKPYRIYPLRVCISCKKEYQPTNGRQIVCKNCKKEYWEIYQKRWAENNKEKVNNGSKRYRLKHLEKVRLKDRLHKQWLSEQKGYKEKRRLRDRILYKKNEGRYKEKARRWRKKNMDKVLFWNRRRELRERGVDGSHTFKEWGELKKKYSYRCSKCNILESKLKNMWYDKRFWKLTEDHVIPISKGGTDYIYNIRPLCISCNSSKGNHE